MDVLVDTNIILRAADRANASYAEAKSAMRAVFRQGGRLCLAKQSLVEAWVVATRPRDLNGFGLSPKFAIGELALAQRIFHILPEADSIFQHWQTLVDRYQVSGKAAYDARLVAAMRVNQITTVLTYNVADFRRYEGIHILRPGRF